MRRRRLTLIVAALAVVHSGILPATWASVDDATASRPVVVLKADLLFSPNGDGVRDESMISWTLPRASDTTRLAIRYRYGTEDLVVRTFGPQSRGTHRWSWDGRADTGRRVADDAYTVSIVADYGGRPTGARRKIVVDTTFSASVSPERYAALSGTPTKVYPRSTEVVDALPLTARAEKSMKRADLRITDRNGRVVLTRDVLTGKREPHTAWERTVPWDGRRSNRPLPVGRYRAFVVGVDKAGNHGRSRPVKVFVSLDRLVWRERTATLTATDTLFTDACGRYYTGNDCPLTFYCGTVRPSDAYVGGLSHRSSACPPEDGGATSPFSAARSVHLVEVPDAGVRGLDATRVSFLGAPTYASETDAGSLLIGDTVTTSAVGGRSPWDEHPRLGNGQPPTNDPGQRIAPAALWFFETTGDNAFDVATFTVDLRFLVLE